MMKKTLAAATVAALVGVAGAASAADLYKGSTKDAPVYVAPPTWTGFYIGAHVGGFWADIKNHDLDGWSGNGRDWGWNNNNDGVFGGGTVGYNYQTGALVFGVEADFGGAGLTGSWNNGIAAGTTGNFWAKNDASFYADVTGRLGYAAGPALFYVKGGWAYLDANVSIGGIDPVFGAWSVKNSGLDGWTVGGGIEYMWSPSWSVKAEYLYFDFGQNHADWIDPSGLDWRFDRDLTVSSFKVGLNYHFGNVYTPLK
jgi:outer membrane immunogenic protein